MASCSLLPAALRCTKATHTGIDALPVVHHGPDAVDDTLAFNEKIIAASAAATQKVPMQTMLRLLLVAATSRAFVPRAPAAAPRPGTSFLRESNGDDFLLDLFEEADREVVEAPDRPARSDYGGGGQASSSGGAAEHDYERAPDDDGLAVDEAAVDVLLAERVQMKRRRLFDEADAIRDELKRAHGVSVWDRERVWRTGGGGGRSPRQRASRSLPACGHDYANGNEEASSSGLEGAAIDALLAERLQCKFARNFERADELQEELFAQGVRVHDGLKLWRDDGGGFGDEQGRGMKAGRTGGSRADREAYAMDADSDEVDAETKESIEELVAERLAAKLDRDYATADSIRETLAETYDCRVDDRKKRWTVGDVPFRGAPDLNAPYVRRGGGDVDALDEVVRMVEERADAKARRDFAAADAIRDALNAQGITVDDRSREWRVADAPYCRACGDAADVDAAVVEALVQERSLAKRNADYDAADAIRNRLRAEFGVGIDDRTREWAVEVSASYGAAGPPVAPWVEEQGRRGSSRAERAAEVPPAAEAPPAAAAEELGVLTVPLLKDLCRDAGLKVGGKKAELVARILEHRAA